MALDGGATPTAYVFVRSIWLYPESLYIAFLFRRKKPPLALLPILNVAIYFMSGA
jgi:hypothetical protein